MLLLGAAVVKMALEMPAAPAALAAAVVVFHKEQISVSRVAFSIMSAQGEQGVRPVLPFIRGRMVPHLGSTAHHWRHRRSVRMVGPAAMALLCHLAVERPEL